MLRDGKRPAIQAKSLNRGRWFVPSNCTKPVDYFVQSLESRRLLSIAPLTTDCPAVADGVGSAVTTAIAVEPISIATTAAPHVDTPVAFAEDFQIAPETSTPSVPSEIQNADSLAGAIPSATVLAHEQSAAANIALAWQAVSDQKPNPDAFTNVQAPDFSASLTSFSFVESFGFDAPSHRSTPRLNFSPQVVLPETSGSAAVPGLTGTATSGQVSAAEQTSSPSNTSTEQTETAQVTAAPAPQSNTPATISAPQTTVVQNANEQNAVAPAAQPVPAAMLPAAAGQVARASAAQPQAQTDYRHTGTPQVVISDVPTLTLDSTNSSGEHTTAGIASFGQGVWNDFSGVAATAVNEAVFNTTGFVLETAAMSQRASNAVALAAGQVRVQLSEAAAASHAIQVAAPKTWTALANLDASLFADSMRVFAHESASLQSLSHLITWKRAVGVLATAMAADAILVGCWYSHRKRLNKNRLISVVA